MPPHERDQTGSWHGDPIAFEGALQTVALLHLDKTGTHCIPKALERLVWYATGSRAVYAQARESRANNSPDPKFDFELLDPNGQVVAEAQGYTVAFQANSAALRGIV